VGCDVDFNSGREPRCDTGPVRCEPVASDAARIAMLSGSAIRFEGATGRDGRRVTDLERHIAEPPVLS